MAKIKGDCTFGGCGRPLHGGGLCSGHYWQRSKGRDLSPLRKRKSPGAPCEVDGCDRASENAGLCRTHYDRKREGREAWDAPVRAKADNGAGFLADDGYRYRYSAVHGRQVGEHRLVMEERLGRLLVEGESVHHLNGQRADNRVSNLELWNTRQPAGQRPEDKVAFALEMLRLYAPERLA